MIFSLIFSSLTILHLNPAFSITAPSQSNIEFTTATIGKAHRLLKTSFKQQASHSFLCPSTSPREIRNRKDLRDLTDIELTQWRTAMSTLMTERPTDAPFNPPPSFWDRLVAIHIVHRDEAHGGAYFLPWHRLFLLLLENYIRETFYPDFALPYWDWSTPADAADAALSTIWGPNYVGGATSGPSPIQLGIFAGLRAHYLDDHAITRDFDSNVSGSMPPLVNSSVLQAVVAIDAGIDPWGNFSDGVETAHDLVHNAIGGDMGSTLTSPNDPIFYLHHAFVDKIWKDRQELYGRNEFGGTHDFRINDVRTSVDATSDFIFQYFDVPVNVTFHQSCVQYQPYVAPSRITANTVTTGEIEADRVCAETDMMSEERCHDGEEVLMASAALSQQSL